MGQQGITIFDVDVKRDADGRYCLNDLQRAATVGKNPRTSEVHAFMRRPETIALADEILTTGNSRSLPVFTKEGRGGGTYVVKEIVYAYAMWVSPAFSLQVIRAYDALAHGALDEALRIARRQNDRQAARLEAPALTDAVIHARKVAGKEVEHYHFSNEFDLINRVALGQSAKQYRAAHGLSADDSIRDTLTALEIKCIGHLQRYNASLIDFGLPFEKRKTELHKLYCLQYAGALACEVQRLEA